ncbi:MAG: hypothetical protein J6J24_04275 [Clostridia bacterium]|nr:hypothetical protein [Clostridia bacterium]
MDYIRVSASYLFNIKIDNKYLLVKSERRNQFQPIGGCYKYFPEAEKFLSSIGATPEKKSNGIGSLMDLRLIIPQQQLDSFIKWFTSGENRETTYDREFNEELISLIPKEKQQLFNIIQAKKQNSGSFDIFFDKEKNLKSIKPMDIISIALSSEQKCVISDVCKHNPNLLIVTKEDILNGYTTLKDNTKVKIGEHTRNILKLPIQTKEL